MFQLCFNVVLRLIWCRDIGKCQIKVELTLSTLRFITLNNVKTMLCWTIFSVLIWTKWDNVETAFKFSLSIFATLHNVVNNVVNMTIRKKKKKINLKSRAKWYVSDSNKNHLNWKSWTQNLLCFISHFKSC